MARLGGLLLVCLILLQTLDDQIEARSLTRPTVGTDYGAAKGGKDNAAAFYKDGFCSLLDWGFNAFYFEAFDEPWKPASIGDNGKAADETTWGAFTSDRTAKFDLKC